MIYCRKNSNICPINNYTPQTKFNTDKLWSNCMRNLASFFLLHYTNKRNAQLTCRTILISLISCSDFSIISRSKFCSTKVMLRSYDSELISVNTEEITSLMKYLVSIYWSKKLIPRILSKLQRLNFDNAFENKQKIL